MQATLPNVRQKHPRPEEVDRDARWQSGTAVSRLLLVYEAR